MAAVVRRCFSGSWGLSSPARHSKVTVAATNSKVSCRRLVTATSPKSIKRFYDKTSTVEHEGRWRVTLDGKVVKTPKGSFLELPTQEIAEGVADEWGCQGERLNPRKMPLTTVGCTAVDLIRPDMDECIARMIPFLCMDTLCFEDDQDNLAELQNKEWGPVREWFQDRFGVKLGLGKGLTGPCHPAQTALVVEEHLKSRDEWELAAMEITTQTAKSFIVAAALLDRTDIGVEEVFRWALLEEHWQIERWGLVEGEHDVSHEETKRWFEASRRFGSAGRQ